MSIPNIGTNISFHVRNPQAVISTKIAMMPKGMSINFLRYFFVSIVCMCLLLCRKNRKNKVSDEKKIFLQRKTTLFQDSQRPTRRWHLVHYHRIDGHCLYGIYGDKTIKQRFTIPPSAKHSAKSQTSNRRKPASRLILYRFQIDNPKDSGDCRH